MKKRSRQGRGYGIVGCLHIRRARLLIQPLWGGPQVKAESHLSQGDAVSTLHLSFPKVTADKRTALETARRKLEEE